MGATAVAVPPGDVLFGVEVLGSPAGRLLIIMGMTMAPATATAVALARNIAALRL
jgi:hypothetical protein